MTPEIIHEELLPTFVSLLRDGEAEVKTAICTQIPGNFMINIQVFSTRSLGFCEVLDIDVIKKQILAPVREIVVDPSQHVRASLASNITGLAPLLGKDMYVLFTWPLLSNIHSFM